MGLKTTVIATIVKLLEKKPKEGGEFDEHQLNEIQWGINSGIDVGIYSDPKFDVFQMDEIRLGLENDIDAVTYADPSIPWWKMQKIRLRLQSEKKEQK